MADWNKIKTEYITHQTSYRKLCKKHNVSMTALTNRAKKEKWVEAKKQFDNNIVTKSVGIAQENAIDYKSTLYDLAYKVAGQLTDLTNKYSLEDLSALGLKPKDITGAIKELEDALHVKSDRDLREQEARISKLQKEASDNESDKEIKVVIEGDLNEYSN